MTRTFSGCSIALLIAIGCGESPQQPRGIVDAATDTDAVIVDAATDTDAVMTTEPVPCATRSETDRPDDATGYQVHVVYAQPADGLDRTLDTNGALSASVAAWSQWFSTTAGRSLRMDTSNGCLDITFFRLTKTEAQVADMGAFVRDEIEAEMTAAGRVAPNKLYAVYYDGKSTYACGGGAWPPTLIGHVAALYLHGVVEGYPPCDSNPLATSADTPGYLELGMLHEVLHTIGVVATCAPHHVLAGHVSDSSNDLMYAGEAAWVPTTMDSDHDDYFGHGNPACVDLARSAFLEPAGPDIPPGW